MNRIAEPSEPPPPEPVPLEPLPPGQEDLLGRRSGAALIDIALLTGVFLIFSLTVGEINTEGGFSAYLSGTWLLIYLAVVLVYYFALEATIGQTVGKRLLGLRVTRRDGTRPSVAAIAVRTLLRLVDWLPVLYLVGFSAIAVTGARRQRLGDLAANTSVGRALPVRHRSLALAPLALVVVLVAVAGYLRATGAITVSHQALSVDRTRIEDSIARNLQREVPDLRVDRVACPKGIKLAEGASFQCTADVEGAQLPFTVTLSHVNTNKGEYDSDFEQAKALIATDKVIEEIQSRLPVEAANATVDCATPRWRVVEVGGAIECTVSQGSRRQVVHAVIDDLDGTGHLEPATVWPVRPKIATGKIGDKLTVYDERGDAQLEVTVTRLKFSTGDEFDRPVRGLFMGAYVTAHAFANEQDIPDIYALVGGHHYSGDAITSSTAFDPYLDPVTLSTGERASGWLVFDVPTRHGQLVLRDLDQHTVGVWRY